MAEQKKKKLWYKRWWAILILGLIVLTIIFGDNSSNISESQNTLPLENNQQQNVSNTLDVWSKSFDYTVDECNQVCEGTYDLQAQIDVCQGNCVGIYGKPSDSLDKYVNTVKDIKNKK